MPDCSADTAAHAGGHAAAAAAAAAVATMTTLMRFAYNDRPSANTDHPAVHDLARPLDASKHSRRRYRIQLSYELLLYQRASF